MPAISSLPISRLINVSVVLAPLGAQSQNLSDLLILGSSDIINVSERLRTYATLTAVAGDFGTAAPEYLAAQAWFGQVPQPSEIKIGRWAQTATKGKLICGTLTATQALIATWTAVASGGFKVTVDGGVQQSILALNFSAVTTLAGVAGIINGALTGAVCTYNSVFNRFEFSSNTTGALSQVSFLSAAASGTDISGMLNGLSTSSGAYQANGIVAESAVTAATLFDTTFGQGWYGLFIIGAADTDHTAVAAFIEGATNKHIYGVNTQEAGVLVTGDTTSIAYTLQQSAYKRTITQYSSTSLYAVCSLLGRILTVNYNGNNTVITLFYKQEPGITGEVLNATQIAALEAKNCNVFVSYNNNTVIIEPGVMASGDYMDVITGTDWLAVTIQTALYNLLYTSPTKIPQTDAGNHLLVVTCESVLSQAVANGLVAPGVWNTAGFGALNQGDFLPKGFYVFAPKIATQLAADRAARKSVPLQIAAKLAGAVHTVAVTINVNR